MATVGAGVGWAITITLHLLLVSTVLLLLSLVLGLGAFLVMGGALVLACSWVGHGWVCCGLVWGRGLGLGPSLPSSSRYIFYLLDEGGLGTEPCAPGIALYDL